MRTRKEQAEHFYTPLGIAFRIIGASHSEAFGKCFIVEGIPHERTFRADQFEFETVIERDNLWELLRLKELKRVKNKRVKENARARKERDRVRKQQDDYDSKMDESLEKASRWTYEPTQPLEEIPDDEPAESETISRADSEGHSSNDERLEVALAMESASEDEEDY
jgi:hypothetical protein